MDFLAGKKADLNLEKLQLRLLPGTERSNGFESQRTRQVKEKTSHGALTVFLRRNGEGSREEPVANVRKGEEKSVQESKHRPLEMDLREGKSWIVNTTETIKFAPRVKQIVVGNLEMPKRRESPELVCVEPAQPPLDGVLAARRLSRTFTKPQQSTRSQCAMTSVEAGDQLTSIQTGSITHVMIVNFSHEETELPKATVLGIAEEISAGIVAELNDEVKTNSKHSTKFKCGVNTVIEDANFERYLQDRLGQLTQKERSVMEPVFRKYRYIFHVEGSKDFKGTDLIEH
jgi:hypothetical protein